MLSLHFEGWFQCRLPTNPDPTDEPRGVSGSTWALAGEPDFDRVIRLSDPVALRSHAPPVGVRIVGVRIDGMPMPDHALNGATVDLLDSPVFEERNGIIAAIGEAPIDPFKLRIAGREVAIVREDLWDQRRPTLRAHEVPAEQLRRRQPPQTGRGMFEMSSPEVADATGIADFPGHFRARRARLIHDLETARDPLEILALRTRVRMIDRARWLEHFRLGFRIDYQFEINGPAEFTGELDRLGGTILWSHYWLPRWPIRFWMGCFDSDTLCAYMRGTLDIPFRSESAGG